MYFLSAGRDFNKALPSGLIVEERTRLLLEVHATEHDYRVTLFEENLRASRLWTFFEERPGIPTLPINLVLNLLRLRHSIHVVFRGSDLQPQTVEEFSLVEDLMSGKVSIPSAKALMKGTASSS